MTRTRPPRHVPTREARSFMFVTPTLPGVHVRAISGQGNCEEGVSAALSPRLWGFVIVAVALACTVPPPPRATPRSSPPLPGPQAFSQHDARGRSLEPRDPASDRRSPEVGGNSRKDRRIDRVPSIPSGRCTCRGSPARDARIARAVPASQASRAHARPPMTPHALRQRGRQDRRAALPPSDRNFGDGGPFAKVSVVVPPFPLAGCGSAGPLRGPWKSGAFPQLHSPGC